MAKEKNLFAVCTLELGGKNPKTDENNFEATIMEAIDESLSTFKNLKKQEFYLNLEHVFEIRKQEIPYKVEEFTNALEEMFGIGARFIEIRIIEAVHKRTPEFIFTPRKGVVIFNEYINSLRAFLLQSLIPEAPILA